MRIDFVVQRNHFITKVQSVVDDVESVVADEAVAIVERIRWIED